MVGVKSKRLEERRVQRMEQRDVVPWASLLNVEDHCFDDFLYAASMQSIYAPREAIIRFYSYLNLKMTENI